ncbi:MAG TPA: glycosyltransferase family 2 protein [Candidatus Tumulicola sp.]|nr:glycosyltransferase family 2 protein [Candidatus Tumulicola sp.]
MGGTGSLGRGRLKDLDPAAVTAVILTRDEERNLPRALTSLPRGMQVFVLDALSRDRTVAFARAAGAEVVQRRWTDFVEARTYALACVRTPWVLMIDADEALDDVLRDALLQAGDDADGYLLERTTYYCGRPLRQWSNEPLLRLFRRGRATLEAHPAAGGRSLLHECWTAGGPVPTLAGTLLHFSYPDRAAYRAKYERYTAAEAAGLDPSAAHTARAVLKGLFARFPWLLFGKGAILDGPRGVYIAYKSAMYEAAAAWKARRH